MSLFDCCTCTSNHATGEDDNQKLFFVCVGLCVFWKRDVKVIPDGCCPVLERSRSVLTVFDSVCVCVCFERGVGR